MLSRKKECFYQSQNFYPKPHLRVRKTTQLLLCSKVLTLTTILSILQRKMQKDLKFPWFFHYCDHKENCSKMVENRHCNITKGSKASLGPINYIHSCENIKTSFHLQILNDIAHDFLWILKLVSQVNHGFPVILSKHLL